MPVPYTEYVEKNKKLLFQENNYKVTKSTESKALELISYGGSFFIKKEEKFNTIIFSTENSSTLCSSLTKAILSREEETYKNFVILINDRYLKLKKVS